MVLNQRVRRIKENHILRAKAPLAAQFEDCLQALQQLSDALEVSQPGLAVCNNSSHSGARLRVWGDQSGASSRMLDYETRCSPVLQLQVLRLLEDAHSLLKRATEAVQASIPDDAEIEPKVLDAGKVVVSETAQYQPAQYQPALIDAGATLYDIDATNALGEYLEEAEGVIDCLVQLLPTLSHPPEEALESRYESRRNAYHHLARALFPSAPPNLIDRLGRSNLRRHLSIEMKTGGSSSSETHESSRRHRAFPAGIPPSGVKSRAIQLDEENYIQSSYARESGFEAPSISQNDSVLTGFTMGLAERERATTGTELSYSSAILRGFMVPSPPVSLPAAEPFECPYCQCEVPLVFSSDEFSQTDWVSHVFRDIKPYMCTFDECFYEHHLYADSNDWFQHELDHHRSQLSWSCGLCQLSFPSADQMGDHLTTSHTDLKPTQVQAIQKASQTYAQGLEMNSITCILCRSDFDSFATLQTHIAGHLESFALATVTDRAAQPSPEVTAGNELMDEYIAGLPEPIEGGVGVDVSTSILQRREEDISPGEHRTRVPDSDWTPDIEDAARDPRNSSHPDNEKNTYPSSDDESQRDFKKIRHNIKARTECFVGRDDDLLSIHSHLSTPGRICIVNGQGGVGKTTLALEYFYRYKSVFPLVFWVEANDPAHAEEKYRAMAACLGLADASHVDQGARISQVQDSLVKSEKRWLLVLDNVTCWWDIVRFIPPSLARTRGVVLLTTRSIVQLLIPLRHEALHHFHKIELGVWPLMHARRFLLTSLQARWAHLEDAELRSHGEYEQATKLAKVVDSLPLAVSMIVGFVKSSRCTLLDFIQMWEEREVSNTTRKRKANVASLDIGVTIDSLWSIGIREVRMNSRRLLDVLSLLDAERIQQSLLIGDHKEDYLEFLDSSQTLSFKRMIADLVARRLVSIREEDSGEPSYAIHPSLQQKIHLDMEDFAFADAFRKAFSLIYSRFPAAHPQQVPQQALWGKCQEYMPHVHSLHNVYRAYHSKDFMAQSSTEDLAQLFYAAGYYVWTRQTTAYNALGFLETARTILDMISVHLKSKIRADVLCLIGVSQLNADCAERAQGLGQLREVWQIRQHIHQSLPTHDNEVLLANAANDYSLFLLNEHKFEQAGQLITDCHRKYLSWGSESEIPFEYSKFYGNYSVVLMFQGQMKKALEHQRKAIHITQLFSGRSAMYYRRTFFLACMLLQADDIQGALDVHLETLRARLELRRRHDFYAIMSMYAVGAMYHHLGNVHTACNYMQRCLESAKMYRWSRVAIARAKYHLALLYRAQGTEEAKASKLEHDADVVLAENQGYAAECVQLVSDKMMILDDLQPTFAGRFTGRGLLKHLQVHI